MYMAERTGERKYVDAAKAVFDWHDRNMMCDDGSAYNDPNSEWNGITVFATIALCEALDRHSTPLDAQTRENGKTNLREWPAGCTVRSTRICPQT